MNHIKIPFENMPLKKRESIEFLLFAIMASVIIGNTLYKWYISYSGRKSLQEANAIIPE